MKTLSKKIFFSGERSLVTVDLLSRKFIYNSLSIVIKKLLFCCLHTMMTPTNAHERSRESHILYLIITKDTLKLLYVRGADKSLARPGRKRATFPAFYGT